MTSRVLLIIGGGIAAYKCLDLIRRLRERNIAVRAVMTCAAHQFVTPLSVGALSNDRVFTDLFSLDDEREIGHIRLSREADLIVVAPATADLIAKMAGGHAGDLATAVLLATDKPVLIAPAMNPRMWRHPATRRNMALMEADGVLVIGPNDGEMAEAGEAGPGRMAEAAELAERIEGLLARDSALPRLKRISAPDVRDSSPPNLPREGGGTASGMRLGESSSLAEEITRSELGETVPPPSPGRLGGGESQSPVVKSPSGSRLSSRGGGEARFASSQGTSASMSLSGRHVLVTSGPTREPIDPVRYIANRSSGKQGHAIAAAAARLGARVTLVSGPVNLPGPDGVLVLAVETAAEMLDAVQANLPADIAILAAAVADWRPATANAQKIKKAREKAPPSLALVENDDILKTIAAQGHARPRLVIGFAAETENVVLHARAKLGSKGADWIVANDVSAEGGAMGGDRNAVHLITREGAENWPDLPKDEVAARLLDRAARHLLTREAAE